MLYSTFKDVIVLNPNNNKERTYKLINMYIYKINAFQYTKTKNNTSLWLQEWYKINILRKLNLCKNVNARYTDAT